MIEKNWKLKTTTKIYIGLCIFFLWLLNIYLVLKLNEEMWKWSRFTLEDWMILYDFCEQKPWPKLSQIVRVYWEKQTDFKNYLLEKYEDN